MGKNALVKRTVVRRAPVLALALVFAALVATGCAGSSGNGTAGGPTTSFPYLIDPLEPGTGFVQLGKNRYPFSGVICATGPVKSDPPGSSRIFGVYANFHVDGALAAVSLTRYRNQMHGSIDTLPTVTETALVEMQGHDEVRGLSAKRFRVVGATKWQDPADPTATTALITRKGDRYDAEGTFSAVGTDTTSTTTARPGSSPPRSDDAGVAGRISARCPATSTTSTTSLTPATTS